MLYDIPPDNLGVEIRHPLDGELFTLFYVRSKCRATTLKVTELQNADNNAAPGYSAQEIERSVNNLRKKNLKGKKRTVAATRDFVHQKWATYSLWVPKPPMVMS